MSSQTDSIKVRVAGIMDPSTHPKFVIGNEHGAFTGIEKFGVQALERATAMAQEVSALIAASEDMAVYVEPLEATIRTVLAQLHFDAAVIIDGIVSKPMLGGDAIVHAHHARDAIVHFLSGSMSFSGTYLESGETCIGAKRTLTRMAKDTGEQEDVVITIHEDLYSLVKLLNSARGSLLLAENFSFWVGTSY